MAKPTAPEPSIALDTARSDPRLGGTVYFTIPLEGIPTTVKNPRVEVLAYQNEQLVYGEAGSVAQATGLDPVVGLDGFLLGGGSSIWLQQGGPAHCVANLFYFGKEKGRETYEFLATCQFEATG